jgi:hypothetical protein
MEKVRKILIISDSSYKPVKMFLDQMPKLAKGFIRLGHDVRNINYGGLLSQLSPFKSRSLSRVLFKKKADEVASRFAENYRPDIVFISFPKCLDAQSVTLLRQMCPACVFIGMDGDPWPSRQKGRIETACELDILLATNNGSFLDEYRQAGVKNCVFVPNFCDPDVDHRYEVGPQWKTDILWTGLIRHDPKRYPTEPLRYKLVSRLAQMPNCTVYGCCGRPQIGGINHLYAISGAKIGLSINSYSGVRLCHSDRLTRYLACGAFVLARTVPDSDLLFKGGLHLRYFDTADEFFELAKWYLEHENERKKIADAGMRWAHKEFNCVKIAGYMLELIEKGKYTAPWTTG